MFGSKKEKSTNNLIPSSNANTFNSLVQGTAITGDITADSDIRIDGKLVGDLECAAKVVIGPTGEVEGSITCQNAVIEGRYKGNLFVHELLQVREKAEVSGNITTDKVIVQSGAIFNVNCKMGHKAYGKNGSASKSEAQRILENAEVS